MDWVWWAFDEVIGTLLGTIIATFGSLLTGLSCLVGSEAGCRNFPGYFEPLLFVAPKAIGLAVVCFVLVRPHLALRFLHRLIAWIHYIFVPHPQSQLLERLNLNLKDANLLKELVDIFFHDISSEPPPVYKSENMTRKAEAQAERYKKEKKLVDAWIELQKSKARAAAYEEARSGL